MIESVSGLPNQPRMATLLSPLPSAAHGSDQVSKNLNSTGKVRQLRPVEVFQRCGQQLHASSAPRGKNSPSFGGSVNLSQPSIASVALPVDQPIRLETGHDPRHRWRLHAFGAGKSAEGYRAAEDDDRESGEARSRKPAGIVFLAQSAQKVDRRGMELVGERARLAVTTHLLPGRSAAQAAFAAMSS